MASLSDIRKRIDSVKSTSQITRAMKMVSASKLRRAQETLEAIRPYCAKTAEITASLALKANKKDHPLLATRPVNKITLIVVASDRGLCGGFNSNLLRKVESQILDWQDEDKTVNLVLVGGRARDYFKRRTQYSVGEIHADVLGKKYREFSDRISDELIDSFNLEDADEVWVAYNYFRSVITNIPTIEKILPYELEDVSEENTAVLIDFIYEPSKEKILDDILPRNIHLRMFRAFSESVTSEHGARMTAMDNSTNNALDMIDRLTLKYNRARQEGITTELSEIIGGAEALKG
jgi:F-type H+-transporting ATPase subunit gamma